VAPLSARLDQRQMRLKPQIAEEGLFPHSFFPCVPRVVFLKANTASAPLPTLADFSQNPE